MGAGSVEGYSGAAKKKKKFDSLIREDDLRLIRLPDGLQIPRKEMPQIKSHDLSDFRKWLEDKGISSEETKANVKELKPTQSAVNGVSIEQNFKNQPIEQLAFEKPIMVSQDNYILDGHHRWYALKERRPNSQISIVAIDIPVKQLLGLMRKYPKVEFRDITERVIQKVVNYLLERYPSVFKTEKRELNSNETRK
jgi:hypothetical protein